MSFLCNKTDKSERRRKRGKSQQEGGRVERGIEGEEEENKEETLRGRTGEEG